MTLKQYIQSVVEHHWNDSQCRMAGIREYAKRSGLIKTRVINGKTVLDHLCWECPSCHRLHHDGYSKRNDLAEALSVNYISGTADDRRHSHCCRHCADSTAFPCGVTSMWYSRQDFTQVQMINGKSVCYEVNKDRIAKHPDGRYVDATVTAGYHHGYRSWKKPHITNQNQPRVFGVELEILCSSRKGAIDDVRKAAIECGLAAERDGSLDGDYGLEVIGPPLKYGEATNPDGAWGRFLGLIQGKATGWDAGTGYGMHVNMHTRTFSILQLSKFVNFINHNADLITAVAGRTETRHCKSASASSLGGLKSSIARYHCPVRDLLLSNGVRERSGTWNIGSGNRILPGPIDKYLACSIRDSDRVEVRSFRSTIRWDRFKRNIQFCDSTQSYIAQVSNVDYLQPKNYLAWLSENQHRYPELASFMYTRPKFSGFMTCEPNKKVAELQELSSNDSDNAKQKTIVRPKAVAASR